MQIIFADFDPTLPINKTVRFSRISTILSRSLTEGRKFFIEEVFSQVNKCFALLRYLCTERSIRKSQLEAFGLL